MEKRFLSSLQKYYLFLQQEIYQKIENLGLLVKKHNNLLIVKYPQSLKNSKEDYIRNSRGIIIDFELI